MKNAPEYLSWEIPAFFQKVQEISRNLLTFTPGESVYCRQRRGENQCA